MTKREISIITSGMEKWQQELRLSYKTVGDLLLHRLITASEAEKLNQIGEQFHVRLTPSYAALMEARHDCPIRMQAIPHLGEADPILPSWGTEMSQEVYGRTHPWHPDAIGDVRNLAAPRLTHRYKNRALLHLSSSCAVYCRFCFRKAHLNNHEENLYNGSLDSAFHYLENNSQIHELILTGGDPLSVSDSAIKSLFERISKIPHIRVVRIHSRMAVTLPCRFTPALLDVFNQDWSFQVCLVSHFNHVRELSAEAQLALKALKKSGVALLNQSVLLKGINDSAESLALLFQGLYELGVIPFYLHHPDWTPGTFHFRVSIEKGKELLSDLRGKIAGPALPQYVLDIPAGYGKISLLESTHRKIRDFPASRSQNREIEGALYEIVPPSTRSGNRSPLLYLDLWHNG